MKYVVQVGEERVIVELEADGVHVGDERLRAHLAEVEGTPVRLVAIGDEVHRVLVRRRGERGRYTLWLDGYRYEVEALDERTRAIRDLSAASNVAAGPAPLLAPMPGLVVRVNVEPGAEVRAGQPLVVMEAMKMENELRSPADGTVKSVAARVGQAVEKGALLIELA
jgi:biotin carboxyl carrier protein